MRDGCVFLACLYLLSSSRPPPSSHPRSISHLLRPHSKHCPSFLVYILVSAVLKRCLFLTANVLSLPLERPRALALWAFVVRGRIVPTRSDEYVRLHLHLSFPKTPPLLH